MVPSYKDAITKISKDLGIPGLTTYTQDWVCELPEEYRATNWIKRYLIACQRNDYENREKQILMDLILDCINEMIEAGDESGDRLWDIAEKILRHESEVYEDIISEWAQEGEPLEVAQPIAPRLRKLRTSG